MRDIPYSFILQETQTSELCETFLIFNPFKRHKQADYARHSLFSTPSRDTNEGVMRDILHFSSPSRDTNERITRDILHFTSSKMHKRANYARHSSFFIPQETQTSELFETFLIFLPLENWFWQNQSGENKKPKKKTAALSGYP